VSHSIPRDPLGRFLAIAAELTAHKRWWEGPTMVRYAALPLVVAPGDPATLAARVDDQGRALVAQQGWFSDLRGGMRFLIAAWLIASGRVPASFTAECEAIRERLRAASVRRGGAYEVVAITMLHVAGKGDQATVHRLQQIYEMMRKHHWWLTGPDDLPACALLAVRGGDLTTMERRIEGTYDRLREHGIWAGGGLQMASQIACLAPGSAAEIVERFTALYEAFKNAGVRMWDGDLDEIALLCQLAQPVATTVRTVLEQRTVIREQLQAVGATVSFSLACGTALLTAHAGRTLAAEVALDLELATLAMAANAARLHEAAKQANSGS